jgi:hypothetical protein
MRRSLWAPWPSSSAFDRLSTAALRRSDSFLFGLLIVRSPYKDRRPSAAFIHPSFALGDRNRKARYRTETGGAEPYILARASRSCREDPTRALVGDPPLDRVTFRATLTRNAVLAAGHDRWTSRAAPLFTLIASSVGLCAPGWDPTRTHDCLIRRRTSSGFAPSGYCLHTGSGRVSAPPPTAWGGIPPRWDRPAHGGLAPLGNGSHPGSATAATGHERPTSKRP